MLRCPVCRADNDQGPQCRRCKADLSLLFTLEQQRQNHLFAAHEAIRAEDWTLAEYHIIEAATIRNADDVRRASALLALVRGDLAQAWTHYRECLSPLT